LVAGRQVEIRTALDKGDGLLIDRLDGFGPTEHLLILRELLFEVMDIT
jgi:hypothetical protein